MSTTTQCQRCGTKLDNVNQAVIIQIRDRNIVSSETICKNCYVSILMNDYNTKGTLSLSLLRGVAEEDPYLQKFADINSFCQILAAYYKIEEKFLELEKKIWFPGSPLRKMLNHLELGDVCSYTESITNHYVLLQNQSLNAKIWFIDDKNSSIEISVDDEDRSMTLSNLTATLPDFLTLIDWVIANHATIAANLD